MGNAPFIALSESRRAVRGGKRGEGPAGFPGKRASRVPRRKWRGGFPRYRKSRGPAVKPGQSGWYREAHLFVLEMTGAIYFGELRIENLELRMDKAIPVPCSLFPVPSIVRGGNSHEHPIRQRAAQPVPALLRGEGPRPHSQRVGHSRERPHRAVHHRRHASAGALPDGREAPDGHPPDRRAEVHPHRRHRRRGRPQPPDLLRDAGQLVPGRLLQEGNDPLELGIPDQSRLAGPGPRQAGLHRV